MYFWTCFFLGVFGWILVAALPDRALEQEIVNALKNR